MNAKHTPGPWQVVEIKRPVGTELQIHGSVCETSAFLVCKFTECLSAQPPQRVANARLIAAAPELLAAGIAMRRINQKSTRADVDAACNLLDAAIKKATA